jgi:uncharacterized protein
MIFILISKENLDKPKATKSDTITSHTDSEARRKIMPKTDIHIASSIRKTGQGYEKVHGFVDLESKKPQRHDITRMIDYSNLIESKYGPEAVQELVQHIHDDVWCKFDSHVTTMEKRATELVNETQSNDNIDGKFKTLIDEAEKSIGDILAYFGIAAEKNVRLYRVSNKDVALLRKAGMTDEDIQHSLLVTRKALEIAHRTGEDLDLELVGRGALFHDLGKSKTHGIEHGKLGAEMGRELGLPESITAIMEKHIRGGLTENEAVELGLPVKDYRLRKPEERIVIYADRLVDIIADKVVTTEDQAEERFEEILSTDIKYGKNDITLKRYLNYHKEIQALMGNS